MEKDSTSFNRNKKSKDGFFPVCRECTAIARKSWTKPEPEEQKRKVREYMAKRRKIPHVKEKENAATKAYSDRNPEKQKARKKKYREENSEKVKLQISAWYKNNRGKCRASLARYRAAKLKATTSWADKENIKLIYVKARRLELWLDEDFNVDHIVPLQSEFVCGLHCEQNLQIITFTDNMVKGNRYWPDMW